MTTLCALRHKDLESDHDSSSETDEGADSRALSKYEIERKKRIAENKRKFEEHLKDLQKKNKPTVYTLRLCT